MKKVFSVFIVGLLSIMIIVPTQVYASNEYKIVDLQERGDFMSVNQIALDSNGELWRIWGELNKEKIEGITNVASFSLGEENIYVIKKDGSLWHSQYDYYYDDSSVKTEFKILEGISNVKLVEARYNEADIIKNDGTVWRYSDGKFTKVDGLDDIVKIYEGRFAINSKGQPYIWGVTTEPGAEDVVHKPELINVPEKIVDFGSLDSGEMLIGESGTLWMVSENYFEDKQVKKDISLNIKVKEIIKSPIGRKIKDIDGNYYGNGISIRGEFFNINPIDSYDGLIPLEKIKGFKKAFGNIGLSSSGELYKWGQIRKNTDLSESNIYNVDRVSGINKFIDDSSYTNIGIYNGGMVINNLNEVLVYGISVNKNDQKDLINLNKDYGYNKYKKSFGVESYDKKIKQIYIVDTDGRIWNLDKAITDDGDFSPKYINGIINPVDIKMNNNSSIIIMDEESNLWEIDYYNNVKKILSNVKDFRVVGNQLLVLEKNEKLSILTYDWDKKEYAVEYEKNGENVKEILYNEGDQYSHTYFVMKNDGSVWGKGSNYAGEIGIGTTEDVEVLTKINEIKNVKKLIKGNSSSVYALLDDGNVYAWGWNKNSSLGLDSTEENVLKPRKVNTLSNIQEIREGTIAYDKNEYLWKFPDNGTLNKVPKRLEGLGVVKEFEFNNRILAIKENGQLVTMNWLDECIDLPIDDAISIKNDIITTKSGTYLSETYTNRSAIVLSTEAFATDLVKLELGQGVIEPDYDVNRDGLVDIEDLATIALNYNIDKSSLEYNINHDFNLDGIIDLYDMVLIAKRI